MLHHALRGFARSARIVIGVAENRVVAQRARARLEALDYFGEKRILDVGNDDAHRAALPRGQVARVHVGKVSEALDRREHQAVRAAAYFAGLVQDV